MEFGNIDSTEICETQLKIPTASASSCSVRVTNEYLQKIYRRLSLLTVSIPFFGTIVKITVPITFGWQFLVGVNLGTIPITLFPIRQMSG
jgi:hypothetical protein